MTQEPLERRVHTVEEAITLMADTQRELQANQSYMAETHRMVADNIDTLAEVVSRMDARHTELMSRMDTRLTMLEQLQAGSAQRQTMLEQLQAESAQRQTILEQLQAESAQRQAEEAQRRARIEERQAETDQRFNILLEEIRFMNRRNRDSQDEE